MKTDGISYSGLITAEIYEGGNIVAIRKSKNFVTTAGEAVNAGRLISGSNPTVTHMGIGTGSGQVWTNNTLAAPLGARVAVTSWTQGAGADDNDVIAVGTFTTSYSGSISEGGTFTDVSAGSMFNYWTFDPPIQKSTSQTLVITARITCGAS